MISKSSLLTLDFPGWLSVQYTQHTLYNKKKVFQERIDVLYIGIDNGFYNYKKKFIRLDAFRFDIKVLLVNPIFSYRIHTKHPV